MDHLLTDTISYSLVTGVGTAGDPTYGSILTTTARVEEDTKLTQTPDGAEWVSFHKLTTKTSLPVGSRIWLPGRSTSDADAADEVDAIKKASLPGGGTLYEVIC